MRFAGGLIVIALLLCAAACSGNSSGQPAQRDPQFIEAQLTELAALACPDDCDPQTWEQLKAALRETILHPPRGANVAPTRLSWRAVMVPGALPDEIAGWWYGTQGDYNQDGAVTIADLTPLGANFLESSPGDFDFTSALSVVDGDGNGEINLADLTPLGINLGATVTAYNIYGSDNAADVPANDADSSINPLAVVEFSEATGNPTTDRKFFPWPAGVSGDFDYIWVRPQDTSTGTEGTRSTVLGDTLTIGLTDPPETGSGMPGDPYQLGDATEFQLMAELQFGGEAIISDGLNFFVTPRSAAEVVGPNLLVGDGNANFTLSAEYVDYEGDPDILISNFVHLRKGEPDQPPVVVLEVTPDTGTRGFTATMDASASTDDGTITTFEWDRNGDGVFELNTGMGSSIDFAASGSGTFAPAVRVTDDGGLSSVASQDITVQGQWNYSIVDNSSEFASPSLTIIGGLPAVAYTDDSADLLKFSRSADANGDIWGVPITPAPLNPGGFQPTLLELFDGRPAVIYQGQPPSNIAGFISAVDAAGAVWNLPQEFSYATNGLSGAIIGDSPALAFHDAADNKLYFERATSLDGSSWNDAPVLVDADAVIDGPPSLIRLNTRPVITYKDTVTGAFMYCEGADTGGSAFIEPVVAIPDVVNSLYTDLLVLGDRPAFVSNYGFAAHYSLAADEFGSIWNAPLNVGPGFMPLKPAGAQLAGVPIVAYCTPNDDQMMFGMALDAEGSVWHTEVIDPSRDMSPDCAMVNGHPAVVYIGPFGELLFASYF